MSLDFFMLVENKLLGLTSLGPVCSISLTPASLQKRKKKESELELYTVVLVQTKYQNQGPNIRSTN